MILPISFVSSSFSSNWINFSTINFPPSTFSLVLVLSLVFLVLFHWLESHINSNLKNYPPGPRSSFMFFRKFWNFFIESDVRFLPSARWFVAEYGKVLGFPKLLVTGFTPVVVINDAHFLKETFNNPDVLARPNLVHVQMYNDGKHRGIACTSGEIWKEIRKFTMTQLHSRGLGMKKLEPAISEEALELAKAIREQDGRPIATSNFFNTSAFNVLWQIWSSQRFHLKDPIAHQFINYVQVTSHAWIQNLMMSCWPKLTTFMLNLVRKNKFIEANKAFLKFSSEFVEGRAADFDKGKRLYDFTDAFIEKIKETKDVNSPFYGQLGYENLNELLRDFFIAGTATTGATVEWTILYLALHPEVQEKVCREIDSVIEKRTPSLEDRPKMKYTEAVIMETLRRSSNVAMGLPHYTSVDVQVGEYTLPKDAIVFPGIYAIHHCMETWGDPYEFRPERFLSEDGQIILKHDSFVPFGTGKRRCPGSALAMDELFLFLTTIVQEFTIELNPAEPRPNMGSKLGLNLDPNPHTIIFNQRRRPGLSNCHG